MKVLRHPFRAGQARASAFGIAAALIAAAASTALHAAPGDIDLRYGQAGYAPAPVGSGPAGGLEQAALDRAGRLLVSVHISDTQAVIWGTKSRTALVRHRADGTLDYGFGDNGVAYVDPAVELLEARRFIHVLQILPQVDGKILLVGLGGTQPADWTQSAGYFKVEGLLFMRLDADGRPDTSFGDGGRALLQLLPLPDQGAGTRLFHLEQTSTGYTGMVLNDEGNGWKVFQLDANGKPDPNWGRDGVREVVMVNPLFRPRQAKRLPDGRVDIFGTLGGQAMVARYQADGRRDPGFQPGFGYQALPPAESGRDANFSPVFVVSQPQGGELVLAAPDAGASQTADFAVDGWRLYQADGAHGGKVAFPAELVRHTVVDVATDDHRVYLLSLKPGEAGGSARLVLHSFVREVSGSAPRADAKFGSQGAVELGLPFTKVLQNIEWRRVFRPFGTTEYQPAPGYGSRILKQGDGRLLVIAHHPELNNGRYVVTRLDGAVPEATEPAPAQPVFSRLSGQWDGGATVRVKVEAISGGQPAGGPIAIYAGEKQVCETTLVQGAAECAVQADLPGSEIISAQRPKTAGTATPTWARERLAKLAGLPETGWWWTPSAPGRGFFLETHGRRIHFVGHYFDETGKSAWGAAGGELQNNGAGRWVLTAPWRELSAGGRQDRVVGQAEVSLGPDGLGQLTLNGRLINLQRFRFADLDGALMLPALHSDTGFWWNPANAGTGYAFEAQGLVAYGANFGFDANGVAKWYAGPGTWFPGKSSPSGFQGTGSNRFDLMLYNYQGGPTLLDGGSKPLQVDEGGWVLFADTQRRTAESFWRRSPGALSRFDF